MGSVHWIVPAATLDVCSCGLSSFGIEVGRVVAGMSDALFKVPSPLSGGGIELCWSGGSVVEWVDPVGGPPHGDVTDEAGA